MLLHIADGAAELYYNIHNLNKRLTFLLLFFIILRDFTIPIDLL